MAYSASILTRAEARLKQAQRAHQQDQARRRAEIYRALPALRRLTASCGRPPPGFWPPPSARGWARRRLWPPCAGRTWPSRTRRPPYWTRPATPPTPWRRPLTVPCATTGAGGARPCATA